MPVAFIKRVSQKNICLCLCNTERQSLCVCVHACMHLHACACTLRPKGKLCCTINVVKMAAGSYGWCAKKTFKNQSLLHMCAVFSVLHNFSVHYLRLWCNTDYEMLYFLFGYFAYLTVGCNVKHWEILATARWSDSINGKCIRAASETAVVFVSVLVSELMSSTQEISFSAIL